MSNKTLLAALLPPAAYDTAQPRLAAEVNAEADMLDNVDSSANAALDGVTPFYAGDLLQDWERVLNITPKADSGYQERLDIILIKLSESGGLDIPYFINLAKSIGYTITIDELQSFRAGTSRCGDTLYIDDIIFTWRVNVYGLQVPIYYFRTGTSRVGERLMTLGDKILESTFNDLKPAHTLCYFRYASEIQDPLYLDGTALLDGEQPMTGYIETDTD